MELYVPNPRCDYKARHSVRAGHQNDFDRVSFYKEHHNVTD